MNYNSKECPPNYKCSVYGAAGCKLWREYNCFNVELHCAGCAAKKEEKDISDGFREASLILYPKG